MRKEAAKNKINDDSGGLETGFKDLTSSTQLQADNKWMEQNEAENL